MLSYHTPLIFMRLGLESFRIVRLSPVQRIAQILRLMVKVGIGSIFGQHQFLPGIVFFESFHPRFDVLHFLFVPAEITVHALYICILIHRMIGVTVTVHGNRVTVRIFRLRQIVKRLSQ